MSEDCKHGNDKSDCELCNDPHIVYLESTIDDLVSELIDVYRSTGNDLRASELKRKYK